MSYRPTLKSLIGALRAVKDDPAIRIKTGIWTEPYWSGVEFRRWFGRCLNEKINYRDPHCPQGRKAGEEYAIELGRLKMYLGNRVIIDWIAPVLGKRVRGALEHRLRQNYA